MEEVLVPPHEGPAVGRPRRVLAEDGGAEEDQVGAQHLLEPGQQGGAGGQLGNEPGTMGEAYRYLL